MVQTDLHPNQMQPGPARGRHSPSPGLAAIAAALLLPLMLGSFSKGQALWRWRRPRRPASRPSRPGSSCWSGGCETSHEALWALARRDELTGVGNYRALHERLAAEISRHRRHGREFALILLDLDGFKAVNERFGHLEGDRLLAEIGAR